MLVRKSIIPGSAETINSKYSQPEYTRPVDYLCDHRLRFKKDLGAAIDVTELCILLSMPDHRVPESVMKDPVTWLYPPLEPHNTGRLRFSPVHEIYFEESGNPS